MLVRKADAQVAGVAVRAADTGRILMLQRSIVDETDPARGKWEFPGGKLEPDETPADGARREWQEETGVQLPQGRYAGCWQNGIYHGCVYVIPHEADVPLNLDGDNRAVTNPDDPDGDDCEVLAWWAPTEAQSSPSLRDEVRDANWTLIHQAVSDSVFKNGGYPVLVISKDSPTAGDSHVDVPLGNDVPRKRRKKVEEDLQGDVAVLKTDDEARVVYGIVLEPDVEDSQGDIVSKEDVELAAHRFLYRQAMTIGDQHRKAAPDGVRPVESYIAPCDFEMNGQTVRKGSWVLAAHVPDDDLWQQIKKGDKGAWSVGGSGKRRALS